MAERRPAPDNLGGLAAADSAGDVLCVQCGYSLAGLGPDDRCPECGTPVARSRRSQLLEFAPAAYLRRVHTGVVLVLCGLAAFAIVTVLGVVGQCAGLLRTPAGGLGFALLAILPTAAMLVGYWLYTTPDPVLTSAGAGLSARRMIRAAVGVQAAVQGVSLLAQLLGWWSPFSPVLGRGVVTSGGGRSYSFTSTSTPINLAQFILLGAGSLVWIAAWIVLFFAVLEYTEWLARRVPDPVLSENARLYTWLIPLLATLGILLVGLDPLIALLLYILLLEGVRTRLAVVRERQRRANLVAPPG